MLESPYSYALESPHALETLARCADSEHHSELETLRPLPLPPSSPLGLGAPPPPLRFLPLLHLPLPPLPPQGEVVMVVRTTASTAELPGLC